MYLVINKCVTAVKVSNFDGHYLRNRSTLDIGVLGYIGIVQHKEHSPEVLSIPPGTPCIYYIDIRGRAGTAPALFITVLDDSARAASQQKRLASGQRATSTHW